MARLRSRPASWLVTALEQAGDSFAHRLAAVARAYVGFAVANAALHDLMYEFKYDPTGSEELVAARQRLGRLTGELVEGGRRRGEVREGPLDRITLPLTATLQGFATRAVGGAIPAEQIEQGLDDTIAFVLRGCMP